MFIARAALASLLVLSPLAVVAQANPPAPASAPAVQPDPAAQAAPAPETAGPVTVFSLLQPALVSTQDTLTGLKLDKWKRGSVRDEATDNVKAILADLQNNLPPLVTAADADPSAVSPSIPLVKHLGAIYDVLLRVEEASRVSAPADQVAQLQQALKTLGSARLAIDDHLQQAAAGQEKRLGELQAALTKAQQPAAQAKPASEPEPCKPPAPVKKKRRPAAAKPAQPTNPTAPQPNAPKPQ